MIVPLYMSLFRFFPKRCESWKSPFYHAYQEDLVSIRHAHPSASTKQRPVFITVHGFGASPFEWQEFKEFTQSRSNALVSSVYLGQHQTSQLFSKSRWEDWVEPVYEEYNALISLGFEHIYLCACSTGATLLLHGLNQKHFRPSLPIKHIILVDPLLHLKQRLFYFLPYLKLLIKDVKTPLTDDENNHWLPIKPLSTLLQLGRLLKQTTSLLKFGISCSSHIAFSVFQAKDDPVINRQSVLDIYNGILKKSLVKINVSVVSSAKHVFTRLAGRTDVTGADIDLQRRVFKKILGLCDASCTGFSYTDSSDASL